MTPPIHAPIPWAARPIAEIGRCVVRFISIGATLCSGERVSESYRWRDPAGKNFLRAREYSFAEMQHRSRRGASVARTSAPMLRHRSGQPGIQDASFEPPSVAFPDPRCRPIARAGLR